MFESKKIAVINGNDVYEREMDNFQAEFHSHQQTQEMFFVLSGKLFIDLETDTIQLTAGQSYTVSVGVKHRARVQELTKAIVVSRGLKA